MKPTLFLFLATLAVPAGAGAQSSFASQFPAGILAAHNAWRAAAGVPPLAWDNALGTAAAAWVAHLAQTGVAEHSDRHARRGQAENIWYGSHGVYNIDQMVGSWASERRNFVPGIFPNVSRTGNWYDVSHYTQVIWPTSQRIGCALASNGAIDFLVCRYSPAGNIDGKRVP